MRIDKIHDSSINYRAVLTGSRLNKIIRHTWFLCLDSEYNSISIPGFLSTRSYNISLASFYI